MVDEYPVKAEPQIIVTSVRKINEYIGIEIPAERIINILTSLHFDVKESEGTLAVTVPDFRLDLEGMPDLAEEVARFFGYDNIPTTLPKGEATTGKLPFKLRIEDVAKEIAEFCGFSQGMTYSFESPKVFDKLRIPADSKLRETVEIMNPLGED